jgi:energy-coupling factor transporter transmembrane protein EcfT
MIDYLSAFSRKVVWLQPLFFCTTVAAIFVFAYVVLSGNSADKEVYIIPCIVGLLWSLVCLVLLFAFPHVPPQPENQQRFYSRLKIRLARGCYYVFAVFFVVLSASAILLTFKLLNVWRIDF